MTERPLSINTQAATLHSTFYSPQLNDTPLLTESADDEPYTIKCICDYSDDDGNTIYCEKCDTWQHIECFYPGRVDDASREEFDHSCADCKPRSLDRRHATERQRLQRQNKLGNDAIDKKIKRPPSKSHKKKPKISEIQSTNFQDHDPHRNSIEHQSSTKKSKVYRSSQQVVIQNKRSPSFTSRQETSSRPLSPAHTLPDLPTNFQLHGYSENFQTLYQQGHVQLTCTNSFASLSVSNSMSEWLRDPNRLYQDAGVRDKEDVFLHLKVSVDTLKWPELRVEKKEDIYQDTILQWQYLITPVHLPQPGRIVELNGLVGFQKDYCSDVENRWTDSAHPRPFVFFHPRLPLFIDTRREGSIGRHVRRSCRSNTNLETFIASGTEYHFWLTSERSLSANEQITISWDFRFPPICRSRFLHLLNLGDEDGAPSDGSDITQEEYEQLTQTIQLVLSDHGGCACDLGSDCAFARFHRNYQQKTLIQAHGVKSKKPRRTKQSYIVVNGTDNSSCSRATSEVRQEQNDEEDSRSLPGSARGKFHSRDPSSVVCNNDTNFVLTEPSDREKRKLAMLEDSFRKMEQGQPPRKKKRASDGTNSSPSVNSTPAQALPRVRQRSNVTSWPPNAQSNSSNQNSSRSRSGEANPRRHIKSPSDTLSLTGEMPPPSSKSLVSDFEKNQTTQLPTVKNLYQDSSTQTDEFKEFWWSRLNPLKRRSIIPLSKRLLRNRCRMEANNSHSDYFSRAFSGEIPLASPMSPNLPIDKYKQLLDDHINSDFTEKQDKLYNSLNGLSTKCNVKSLDSTNTTSELLMPASNPQNNIVEASITLCPQLSINPNFNISDNYSISYNTTLSENLGASIIPPTLHNNSIQQLSPIKMTKKLSLSDYKAARLKKTDSSAASTTKQSQGNNSPTIKISSLKPSLLARHEVKSPVMLENNRKEDSPTSDQ
ncbi:BgTH12-06802 [Blumeria graminis f. sp. triticale]|uniref:Bgt-2048 n=4 Tax=Blumeria graminis TaxID=34373 RepID=A0A9X9MNZ1_BLUGR|nr:BgTH12-06802 [Blumeria graminis f. sp. triticale]VDB94457.1 Bgt-2048 [Blumeria graminis f. sp. tritici]